MVNAGRVLIITQGPWDNLKSYTQLDLVSYNKIAYLARQASVGVNPSTDTQMIYWQPFGSVADIATTEKPGLVMPDGTTIVIDNEGKISVDIDLDDISNIEIATPSNGDVMRYNSTTEKWENAALGTAAVKDSTNAVTENSQALVESGAVFSKIGKVTTKTLAANATTVEFDVPTSGDHLIDFFISDGSFYTAIDLSVTGKATLTFKASANSRSVSCRISNI